MSYSAQISFKTIDAEDISEFFVKIKKECESKQAEIAKNYFTWSPYGRKLVDHHLKYFDVYEKYPGIDDAVELWVYRTFTFRWFYLKEYKLLGIYGLPNEVLTLCDCTVYFQNSCDQDYEFDEWNGVPIFEEIAEKWKNTPDQYFVKEMEDSTCDVEYYRKWSAYKEIWSMLEDTLEDDSSITYISLFGFWDSFTHYFKLATWKNWVEQCNEWDKEEEERKAKEKNNHES